MRAGAAPLAMASRTALARAITRASGSALGAEVTTCQPSSFVQVCHCGASAGSTTAIAGVCAWAGSALIMTQAAANALGQLFNFIRLLEAPHRNHVCLVLLQLHLQVLGEVDQLGGVLDVLFPFLFEDLGARRLAVGELDIAGRGGRAAAGLSEREPGRRNERERRRAAHNRSSHFGTYRL